MNWTEGQFVIHKNKPDWGVGKVIQATSQEVVVFFIDEGRMRFSQIAAFQSANCSNLERAFFDRLIPFSSEGQERFLPLRDCVQYFLKLFPGGFDDPNYLSVNTGAGERAYKLAASQLASTLLSKPAWEELSSTGNFDEICKRLGTVESKTNLLHTFEKIKWHAALKNPQLQQPLADALFNDLYGSADRQTRFNGLAKVLAQADSCAKWTIATYYGFLLQPEPRMFIKPEVTKFAAKACGWDIQYASELNWATLNSVEDFASYLFGKLKRRGLTPRDMIDVQSFIWCIDPKSYA